MWEDKKTFPFSTLLTAAENMVCDGIAKEDERKQVVAWSITM